MSGAAGLARSDLRNRAVFVSVLDHGVFRHPAICALFLFRVGAGAG